MKIVQEQSSVKNSTGLCFYQELHLMLLGYNQRFCSGNDKPQQFLQSLVFQEKCGSLFQKPQKTIIFDNAHYVKQYAYV